MKAVCMNIPNMQKLAHNTELDTKQPIRFACLHLNRARMQFLLGQTLQYSSRKQDRTGHAKQGTTSEPLRNYGVKTSALSQLLTSAPAKTKSVRARRRQIPPSSRGCRTSSMGDSSESTHTSGNLRWGLIRNMTGSCLPWIRRLCRRQHPIIKAFYKLSWTVSHIPQRYGPRVEVAA